MRTIYIYQADATPGRPLVEPAAIEINGSMPGFKIGNGKDCEEFYMAQAKQIEQVLIKCLPQGTLDRLISNLLLSHSSNRRGARR